MRVLHVRSLWACEHDVEVGDDVDPDDWDYLIRDRIDCHHPDLVDFEVDE